MSFGWGASPCIGIGARAREDGRFRELWRAFGGPSEGRAEDPQRGFNDLAAER